MKNYATKLKKKKKKVLSHTQNAHVWVCVYIYIYIYIYLHVDIFLVNSPGKIDFIIWKSCSPKLSQTRTKTNK